MKKGQEKPKKQVILAFDPSLSGWGYAVIGAGTEKLLASGCIKTTPSPKKLRIRKSDDRARRINELNIQFKRIMAEYNVRLIVCEAPHGSQSAVSALMIGVVLGIVQTIADLQEIPIEYYSEGDIKKHVLDKRAAAKNEMIEAMQREFGWRPTGTKYIDEAVADALGVYVTAADTGQMVKMVGAV